MVTKKQEDVLDEPAMPDEEFDPLDLDPQGWRPEPGAKLWGRVVKVSDALSAYPQAGRETYPLIQVFTDSGDLVNVHAFHSVLRSNIESTHPQYGDRIGIKYRGKKLVNAAGDPVGLNGEGYEDYNVIVIPAERVALSGQAPQASLPPASE